MEVGAIIGEQYTIMEHIGRGGMADVWSARDQRLRRMVAIKTIAVGLTQDIDPVSMFQNEAQTIASMEHPHILPIYDFGEHAGALYIVMRFVTGGSLENLMTNPMPPVDVLRIGDAIAAALDYAHTNKIIHLDLKPANILMDSGGAPYLADFGLATVLDPEGRARNPGSGTLLYMAPEQLTAELIDHRADIYSFSIMMYHMLTGKLPYDGLIPLALRQIQFNDEMPAIEARVPSLPASVNDVLRRGTAKDLSQRPASLTVLMEELRAILQPGSVRGLDGGRLLDEEDQALADVINMQTERLLSLGDRDLLEAVDIYARARYNWAGGQGRFLVSLTHFLIMSNYYVDARRYELPIDQPGAQMLLRGALEYDHDADFWWAANSEDDRRWVCLHTLRTGTTPARIRAMYRLETLTDDPSNPVIPKLVAQALEVERDTSARLAAIQVLTTRAKMTQAGSVYRIRTEFIGRLLTSMTRLGIEMTPTTLWLDPVYTPEIDIMIAEQALDMTTPVVAEAAARGVGRMHSLPGVRYLANEQRVKRAGALQALALVRDEVAKLPEVVSPQARAYAWIANTLRRVTDRPLDLILRFTLALLGGWIAFGLHIYTTWYSLELVSPTRWGNAIATGLTASVFVGLIVLVTDELSTRLRGFWAWWLRLLLCSLLGILMGTLMWAAFRWFYYRQEPAWDLMRLGGMGLALGFVFVSLVNWKRWKALLLPAALLYFPIVVAVSNECLQDFNCTFPDGTLWSPAFNYFPVAAAGLALGVLVGWFVPRRDSLTPLVNLPPLTKIGLAGVLGAVWSALIWWSYITIYRQHYINYDHISLWFFGSLVFGLLLAAFMQRTQTLALVSVALVSTGLLTVFSTHAIFNSYEVLGLNYLDPVNFVAPQQDTGINGDRDSLVTYLYPQQVLTVGIPMVLVIALGAYVQSTFASLVAFVGRPRQFHRGRDPWLSGVLAYSLFASGLISIFALFSMHVNVLYGLLWSLWGFLTFVATLAAWRWARWGARAMLGLGVLLVIGAFVFDMLTTASMFAQIQKIVDLPLDQRPSTLLDPSVMLVWGMWSIVVGLCTLGALRRQLWAGIGLVVLMALWYIVTIPGLLPAFGTIQALTALALVAYVLQPVMYEMEARRWPLTLRRPTPAPVPVPVEAEFVPRLTTLPLTLSADERAELAEQHQIANLKTQLDARATVAIPAASLPTVLDVPPLVTRVLDPLNDYVPEKETPVVSGNQPTPPTIVFATNEAVPSPPVPAEEPPAEEPPVVSRPRLKFDMRGMGGKEPLQTNVQKPTAPERRETPKLKFDTSALVEKPAPEAAPPDPASEAKSTAPKLKFDTSALQSRPSETQGQRPKLRIDTSALKKNVPEADSDTGEDTAPDERDE